MPNDARASGRRTWCRGTRSGLSFRPNSAEPAEPGRRVRARIPDRSHPRGRRYLMRLHHLAVARGRVCDRHLVGFGEVPDRGRTCGWLDRRSIAARECRPAQAYDRRSGWLSRMRC